MILAIDFDGVVVKQDRPYADTETPLEFENGARAALLALQRAGHVLLLWSGRASRALLIDPTLDPLVRAGVRRIDMERWKRSQVLNIARHRQMLDFVARELPGVFAAVDDGAGGKPTVDLFIDDRAIRFGNARGGDGWWAIAERYGQPESTPDAEYQERALMVPTVAQRTDFSCGAAALQAVLIYNGIHVNNERTLYKALGTTPQDGTAPEKIADVARKFGLKANWRTGIEVADLRAAIDAGVPVILDVQEPVDGKTKPSLPDGHYVVLMGIDDQRVMYMNPSGGKVDTLPHAELINRWRDVDGVRGGIFVDGRAG